MQIVSHLWLAFHLIDAAGGDCHFRGLLFVWLGSIRDGLFGEVRANGRGGS